MLPGPQHPTWGRLIRGDLTHEFKNFAAGMLFFNLRIMYKRDPNHFFDQVGEAHKFFVKYEAILADDIKVLFR
ncbi:MAG TPA: hypothetical protein VF316_09730 [Polyangiaceae bacterium]